jgi:glycosyltransferase involved in cell wall biosynthesis
MSATNFDGCIFWPNGDVQTVQFDERAAVLPRQPLVSCLMVSRGDVRVLRYSLDCYLRQDYANRELILVTSHPSTELRALVDRCAAARVKLVEAPDGLTLGELRNISYSHAEGEFVCSWDDDDLFDPQRLSTCIKALVTHDTAAAVFLSRWLVWWPARRLIAVSDQRAWEGSMLARRKFVPPFPSLSLGEDTSVVHALARDHPVLLIERPWLYCYAVTGRNSWNQSHFEKMISLSLLTFQGEDYDKAIARLARRMPIRQYADFLEQLPAAEPEAASA